MEEEKVENIAMGAGGITGTAIGVTAAKIGITALGTGAGMISVTSGLATVGSVVGGGMVAEIMVSSAGVGALAIAGLFAGRAVYKKFRKKQTHGS